MSRAFDDHQLRILETGAPEEVERLCAEVRRLYAAEDAAQVRMDSLLALMIGSHQQLQATGRTLESALRLLSPPQPSSPPSEPQRKRPRVMGEQPGETQT